MFLEEYPLEEANRALYELKFEKTKGAQRCREFLKTCRKVRHLCADSVQGLGKNIPVEEKIFTRFCRIKNF